MTTLRLETISPQPVDLVLGRSRCTLWRHGDEVLLAVDDAAAVTIRRELAFRGVRATPAPDGAPVPPPLVRAVGIDLAPVRLGRGELDVIEVSPVALPGSTARSLRRPIRSWPLASRRKSQCRALLRGTDAMFEVRRTAWCARATLRAARGSLRPALFDRAANSRTYRLLASEARLSRWIGG